LEAACLLSASDGNVDDAERDAIRRAALVLGASAEESDAGNLLERCLGFADSEQIKVEIDRVGAALAAAGVAREGVVAAAVVGLASQGMSLGELEALRRLANAAGMDAAAVGPLIDVADSTLSAT
jgi:hypothetical protein